MRFEGKVIIITGAASGLGRFLANKFAAEGAKVVVADVNIEGARETVRQVTDSGGLAMATETDVASKAAVEEMVAAATAEFGPVDVLINNAKFSSDEPLESLSVDNWRRNVDVVLEGAFLCTQAVLPSMVERRAGSIVNIGSVNAFGYYGNFAYSAAKAGLVNLTKSIAVQYGRSQVRANMVAPGTMRSPVWEKRERRNPGILDRVAAWYPLGRIGTAEDVSGAVLFLASDEAAWITGAILPVDGGLLAGNLPMSEDIIRNADLDP